MGTGTGGHTERSVRIGRDWILKIVWKGFQTPKREKTTLYIWNKVQLMTEVAFELANNDNGKIHSGFLGTGMMRKTFGFQFSALAPYESETVSSSCVADWEKELQLDAWVGQKLHRVGFVCPSYFQNSCLKLTLQSPAWIEKVAIANIVHQNFYGIAWVFWVELVCQSSTSYFECLVGISHLQGKTNDSDRFKM
ncbi:hypothetical protein WISP_115050 [Willisornis vidua]|uniref:Uncharacterized protein n=1 Tax=Willisornis vidua TaxID=1566151 RepID=A0ABQ9D0P2_9PASS|nr:hypothetical protein WISP_115050 [Willisornis vidua]